MRCVEAEVVGEEEQLAYRKFLGSWSSVFPGQNCERGSTPRTYAGKRPKPTGLAKNAIDPLEIVQKLVETP